MNQPSILIQPMGSLQDIPVAAQMQEYTQKDRLNSKTNIGGDSKSRNLPSNGANFQKSFQKILLEDMNVQPIQQQQQSYSGLPPTAQNKKQRSGSSNLQLKIPLSESPKRFIALNLDPKSSPPKQPQHNNNDNSTIKVDNIASQSFEDKQFLSDKKQEFQHFQENNHHHTNKTIIQNFKMKDFPEKNLPAAINVLVYGIEVEICIPSRRTAKKLFLVMSISTSEKIKAIDMISKTQKYVDVTSIKDVEYNVQNESQASIRGVDPKRIVSFVVSGNEDIECLAQFKSPEERDLFMQGFQYFVKKSHKAQLYSGNIIQLRQQISQMVNSENGKTKKTYDLREVSDILQTKVHLSVSQPYLASIYINIIKKDLDLQLKSQKISYSEYQQAISGKQPGKQQRITNPQLLEIIDFILDRTELYPPFEKATGITNLYSQDKTLNSLTLEGFKKFVLLDQKEIISISEIEDLFDKILETQQNQPQEQHFDPAAGNQQIDENSAENYDSNRTPPSKSREALSFNGFVRFIYSKNNSIFDPRKENIYQNMDKPINEYFINSAKNIFHANFDIITMTKLAGRNIGNSDQNFPLLYALSRGARYIEIEVWDGEKDPVIIFGPIMNSKLELSDFLNQLKRLAFSLSPFPLFLQIVNHCSVKQSFKMKYILETQLKDYLYTLPPDYKDMQNLPSPNELREKIILIGKLPHAYDEIIKESYTYSDAIQARLLQAIQTGKDHVVADNKGQASQLQSIVVNGTAPTNGFSVVNGVPNDIHNANTTVNFNQSSQLIFSNLTANPLNSPNRQVSASVYFPNSNNNNNNNANLSVASNKGKGLEDLSLRQQQNQQLSGLPSLQNRSMISSSMAPIDGTLLTPIHALSLHNIGDSLDQEMMEFIMKEEFEDLTPERIIAIPSKAINTNIDSNNSNLNNNTLLLKPQSTNNPTKNQNLQEFISESEFIVNPNQQLLFFSSVKAIDTFFHKNHDQPPKFKRFLQNKYEEIITDPGKLEDLDKFQTSKQLYSEQQEKSDLQHAQPTRLYNVPVLPGESIDVSTPRDSQLSSKLQIGRSRNGTVESQKCDKEEKKRDENNMQNDVLSGAKSAKNTKTSKVDDNQSVLKCKPSFKKDSLRLQGLSGNGCTSGSTSNRNLSPQAFQIRCIRDYAPIRASNSIESLFGLYVSKIWEKKPALWEIYEFTQRDLSKNILSKQLIGSVLGSFSSLSSFTREHLAIGKPRCKTADSINLDPLPLFAQGVQFVLNYFHTFDRGSLMYQSKFQQNGGETSGYVLKPFNQRNHFAFSPKKSPKSPKKQIETLDKLPVSNNQTVTKINDGTQVFDTKPDNPGTLINQPSENSNNNNDSVIKNNNGKNQSSDNSILVPSTSTFPQIFSLNPGAYLSPKKRQRDNKYINEASDQQGSIAAQLAYEQEEIDNYSLPNLVHIKIISGYNLSTAAGDKVDPYVELIVEDGNDVLDFKTGFVENNNMKPLWYHDVKFTVNSPMFCFLLFQCINTSTGGLIGWFALPFNCVRQGFRVIPLRDGFFNVIKNSFILCEITIVKCPSPDL